MANEEFFVTVLALVFFALVLYIIASQVFVQNPVYYSSFGGSAKEKIIISTKKSYEGINDLVKEFNKTYPPTAPIYTMQRGYYIPVSMEAPLTDSSMDSKTVKIVSPKGYDRYDNRETKNSMWNTDRPARSRLVDFIKEFELIERVAPIAFNPGTDPKKNEFTYYIATKTYDAGVDRLVTILNAVCTSNSLTKVYAPKSQTEKLPIKFYTCIVGSIHDTQLHIYENDKKEPVFTSARTHTKEQFPWEDRSTMTDEYRLDRFVYYTNILVEHYVSKRCQINSKLDDYVPPPPSMCDEKVNHCYFLRTYVGGDNIKMCKENAPKRLTSAVNSFNKISTESKLVHPVTKKPVKFYGAVLPMSTKNPSFDQKVLGTIDSSDKVLSVTYRDIQLGRSKYLTDGRNYVQRSMDTKGDSPQTYV